MGHYGPWHRMAQGEGSCLGNSEITSAGVSRAVYALPAGAIECKVGEESDIARRAM